MHGVRSTRVGVTNRVRFLREAGYSVLLFDFQAHGKSGGEHISYGKLESRDAEAAVAFVKANAAAKPKEQWLVEGAQHTDMYEFGPVEYEKRVGAFLHAHLQTSTNTIQH